MRTIDHIVIHCSATREDRSLTVAELEENHRCRGFRGIGYHYYIRKDGTVINTRALELVGAHAKGHNSHSIGVPKIPVRLNNALRSGCLCINS